MPIEKLEIEIMGRVFTLTSVDYFPETQHLNMSVFESNQVVDSVVLDYASREILFINDRSLTGEEKKGIESVLQLYQENLIN